MNSSHNQIVSLIWNIADDVLRDVFSRGQYRDVILPMVVLRRLDALLEPTKIEVEQELVAQNELGLDEVDGDALKDITGLSYYNTSRWTLNRLKSQATDNNNLLLDNFLDYLNGYSENVRDVLKNFDYYTKAERLAASDRLLAIIERITDPHINLTDRAVTSPDGLTLPAVSNVGMGTLFEELLRRFNEDNNEAAGEHFTPRDAIILLSQLVFEPIKNNLPQIISIYDPACGSGGMLTESREYLLSLGVNESAILLSGTECNPETYAICKSDLIIKGVNPDGMNQGNTITDNHFADTSFGYMITNPPYGKSWKEDKKKIYHEKELLDHRFELRLPNFAGEIETLDCTPRTSDGQLLFMLENVDKMKSLSQQPQGSRIASIHNGSSLFTGEAGSGEGNIRRYLVENDLVEAIVQLPNNIFYNTGISTYVWLLTNKKEARRKDKIQLIDASLAFEKLRKNQGSRNCTIAERHREAILRTYLSFAEQETDADGVSSKIFDGDDFRYHSVTIERPLRLRCQFNALRIDELLYDKSDYELSQWLYATYGEQVYSGLAEKVVAIKEYFQENEIKVTDKKLAKLISPKNWCERRDLSALAYRLMHEVGTGEYMDYNVFYTAITNAAAEAKLKAKPADLKLIARAMSVADENAEKVIKKTHKSKAREITRLITTYHIPEERLSDYGYFPSPKGGYVEYETDSNLRDGEKIPVKEDIYDYFMREVRPYVAEAWINLPATKIGCDISFNKHFYKPEPLRSLEENERDIRILEEQSQGLIQSLFA